MYSSPIIVVGSGRSGTSIISGMLNYLGVNMGPDDALIPANEHNPAGHWEDSNFKKNNLLYIHNDIDADKFEENTYKLFNKSATKNRFWGWKVPSTSTLLANYLDLWFERQDEKPKVIWCKRPIDEVEESMREHYGWDEEQSEKLIARRLNGIKEGLEKFDVDLLELELQEMHRDAETVVERLIDFTGIKPYPDQIERANELVVEDRPDENTRVMIATPTMGTIHKELVMWYMTWAHENRYERKMLFPTAIPYEKNINKIIAEDFLASEEADYLLLVDEDNPPIKDPLDLVELDKDIIGCPTPVWHGDADNKVESNAMHKIGKSFSSVPKEEQYGLKEVDAMGSGCMLISRRVLESFDGRWFNPNWNEDGTSRRSGDFNFCTKAREKGWKVWAHFDYPCEHLQETPLKKVDEHAEWIKSVNNKYDENRVDGKTTE